MIAKAPWWDRLNRLLLPYIGPPPLGPYELKPRKGGEKFEGYYLGQVMADAKQFPHGDVRYKATVEVPDSAGDTLDAEFLVRKSDPELDETRPDFAALERLAGTVEEVRAKLGGDQSKIQKLLGTNTDQTKAKLTMKLGEPDRIAVIPDCMDKKFNRQRNLGGIDDLWDDEYEPRAGLRDLLHYQVFDFPIGWSQTINVGRIGTLMALPAILLAALLILFGQRSGLLAQLFRILALMTGFLATLPFAIYAVANFFVEYEGQQGLLGKIVELSLSGIVLLPLFACVVGLFVFWSSDQFRAQASRMGALFIGLYAALMVYGAYSFPVAVALVVVVSLLCTEWLSRKLLRLA